MSVRPFPHPHMTGRRELQCSASSSEIAVAQGVAVCKSTVPEAQLLPVIISQYKTALSPAESVPCWKIRL